MASGSVILWAEILCGGHCADAIFGELAADNSRSRELGALRPLGALLKDCPLCVPAQPESAKATAARTTGDNANLFMTFLLVKIFN
jgi:hypothetical protein